MAAAVEAVEDGTSKGGSGIGISIRPDPIVKSVLLHPVVQSQIRRDVVDPADLLARLGERLENVLPHDLDGAEAILAGQAEPTPVDPQLAGAEALEVHDPAPHLPAAGPNRLAGETLWAEHPRQKDAPDGAARQERGFMVARATLGSISKTTFGPRV